MQCYRIIVYGLQKWKTSKAASIKSSSCGSECKFCFFLKSKAIRNIYIQYHDVWAFNEQAKVNFWTAECLDHKPWCCTDLKKNESVYRKSGLNQFFFVWVSSTMLDSLLKFVIELSPHLHPLLDFKIAYVLILSCF